MVEENRKQKKTAKITETGPDGSGPPHEKIRKPLRGWHKALISAASALLMILTAVGGVYGYYEVTGDTGVIKPFLKVALSYAAENADYAGKDDAAPLPSSAGTPLPSSFSDVDDPADEWLLPGETYTPTEVSPIETADTEVTNVLLMGIDRWKGERAGRSDSNIIISLDRKNKRVKLTSLMRDMEVEIPDNGERKLNTAYALGGPELTINVVNKTFDLDIQKYIIVDIRGVEKIVDKLGGVTIYVHPSELDLLNRSVLLANERIGGKIREPLAEAGKQKLNGRQAVAYMRIRKVGSADYGRTRRQREVMSAIFEKIKKKNIFEMMPVFESIFSIIQTNMTKDEMVNMIIDTFTLMDNEVLQFRVPIEGHFTVDGTMLLPTQPDTALLLHQFIFTGVPPPEMEKMMKEKYWGPVPSPTPSVPPSPTEPPLPSSTEPPSPTPAPEPTPSPEPTSS
ncbi:MAG: LCP family protein [Bacillota bacterium]|nr:LCP family protein [Bacillota bacterium]